MKQFFIFLFFFAGILPGCLAQPNVDIDSLNYEQQRKRVNNLLEERSRRFGAFDNSLRQKTGIFGLFKRKADMQKSIDILREVVLADNDIFLETKKLLDIKGNESSRNENLVIQYDREILGYMQTITKLQSENEKLRQQIDILNNQQRSQRTIIFCTILLLLGLGFITFRYFKDRKHQNLTQE